MLIVMAMATFVEKSHSTDFAHAYVYGAWWFVALWGALAAAGVAYYIMYMRKSKPFGKSLLRGCADTGLHFAFVLILAGALCSHLFGYNGTIHLRSNLPENMMVVNDNGRYPIKHLPFKVILNDFRIMEDESGRVVDYVSRFSIIDNEGQRQCEVSMNNICKYGEYRFYQTSYDDDLQGSVLTINHDYYGIAITYTGYLLLFLSFLLLVLRKQKKPSAANGLAKHSRKRQWWIAALVVLLTALWCLDYFVLDGSWREIPILRHPLLAIHVVTIILAYALLLIMAVRSLWWLVRKSAQSPSQNPASQSKELVVALGLLSAGIFIGAIWANVSWGNYWSWDAKETWALITLMVYAVPAHRRSLPVFSNPKVYHTYILLAFLSILMTYFGVNYFLTGMHSYA